MSLRRQCFLGLGAAPHAYPMNAVRGAHRGWTAPLALREARPPGKKLGAATGSQKIWLRPHRNHHTKVRSVREIERWRNDAYTTARLQ